jgi:CRISPR-associated protein Cas1
MKDYYIFSPGRLRRAENTLSLEYSEGQKRFIPIKDIYSIHLLGEVDLNTRLFIFLNQSGIPVHFYNYYGYYSGSFYPREKLLSGFLTVSQVKLYLDNNLRCELAREFVKAGISNILLNLKHYEKHGKVLSHKIAIIKSELEELENANQITHIMGIEGRIRECYYSTFDIILRDGFAFEKRTKMPPKNMINSLISFGNSLLYTTILTEIYHTQLNPLVSYLHEPGYRRYSLSLDISEVFKPIIVDRVLFNLINNRMLSHENFIHELEGCLLNDTGKKTFLREYQKKLESTIRHTGLKRNISFQKLIRLECYKLIKHILSEKKYVGLNLSYVK